MPISDNEWFAQPAPAVHMLGGRRATSPAMEEWTGDCTDR